MNKNFLLIGVATILLSGQQIVGSEGPSGPTREDCEKNPTFLAKAASWTGSVVTPMLGGVYGFAGAIAVMFLGSRVGIDLPRNGSEEFILGLSTLSGAASFAFLQAKHNWWDVSKEEKPLVKLASRTAKLSIPMVAGYGGALSGVVAGDILGSLLVQHRCEGKIRCSCASLPFAYSGACLGALLGAVGTAYLQDRYEWWGTVSKKKPMKIKVSVSPKLKDFIKKSKAQNSGS